MLHRTYAYLLYINNFIIEPDKIGYQGNVFFLEQGTFHTKMGSIKDRNGMDLREAEDIKKRWQEYTEELSKNIFMTQIITMV